ncbi:hypothetical protein PoB_002604600 [Plakobranchus ocellatus]|uniref:Uncharacterized protein n=1 Tax=Plakobranchus ocellatus TaxID=259542 RepID=A0AAV3ZUB2_9GAST|nr:hypothetical protein PoB_002604600 [Plakobranchus ocellatus]
MAVSHKSITTAQPYLEGHRGAFYLLLKRKEGMGGGGYDCGTVDNEPVLRSAKTLLSRVQAPPLARGLTEGLKA